MPLKILLVEDDHDIREVFALSLEDAGYSVDTADDATRALAYLEQHATPAVILVDLNLPGMSGDELCAAMRRIPGRANIPVVLLSGHADLAARAAAVGAAGYLRKPVRLDRLILTVAPFCR